MNLGRVTATLAIGALLGSAQAGAEQLWVADAGPAHDVERARRLLEEGTRSGNPDTRREATVAIGLIGTHEHAATLLFKLLHDKDVKVRLAAIASLADLRERRAIPELKDALHDPVPEVEFAAAKSLWTMKVQAGREFLLSVLAGETKATSNPVRAQFRDWMRTVEVPRTAFLFALKQGIGMVPLPGVGEGYAAFEALFSDRGVSARASVALLLAHDHDPGTQAALLNALADQDWSVRAAAAQAIALRNEPYLAPHLVPLLDDNNDKVQYRAAAGYLRLARIAGRV